MSPTRFLEESTPSIMRTRRDCPTGIVTLPAGAGEVGTDATAAILAWGASGSGGVSPPTLTENQATGAPLKLSPEDTHPCCCGLATSILIASPILNTFWARSNGGNPSTTISVSVQEVTKTAAQTPELD